MSMSRKSEIAYVPKKYNEKKYDTRPTIQLKRLRENSYNLQLKVIPYFNKLLDICITAFARGKRQSEDCMNNGEKNSESRFLNRT